MPENAYKETRMVKIYYSDCVVGFRFLDKNEKLLFKIGWCDQGWNFKTVVISDEQVIIGVVAKLYLGY